mgnify:CR=1 FL=1
MFLKGLLVGVFIGGIVGFFVAALCAASRHNDEGY